MILINRTYSEITPESAEDGEVSDRGFICENAEYSFKELVRLLRDCTEASVSPCVDPSPFTWFSTGYQTEDYRTGTEREECVHYSRDNPPRSLKYWAKAARAAGVCK